MSVSSSKSANPDAPPSYNGYFSTPRELVEWLRHRCLDETTIKFHMKHYWVGMIDLFGLISRAKNAEVTIHYIPSKESFQTLIRALIPYQARITLLRLTGAYEHLQDDSLVSEITQFTSVTFLSVIGFQLPIRPVSAIKLIHALPQFPKLETFHTDDCVADMGTIPTLYDVVRRCPALREVVILEDDRLYHDRTQEEVDWTRDQITRLNRRMDNICRFQRQAVQLLLPALQPHPDRPYLLPEHVRLLFEFLR